MRIKQPRRLWRILAVILLLALLTCFGIQYVKQEMVLRDQQTKLAEMQQQTDELNKKYAALLEQSKDKGSLESVERYMRERFGMVKDNEWILQVEGKD